MSVYTFNDNFQINAPKHIDTRYINLFTPWASTAAANAAIPGAYRYLGLTVLIGTTEYWYQAGITDPDLVPKGVAGGLLTANNGLTANTATNVQLGGSLMQDTNIQGDDGLGGTFVLEVLGTTPSGAGLFQVGNFNPTFGIAGNFSVIGSSSIALTVGATGGEGISCSVTTGTGMTINATSGIGLSCQATTGIAAQFVIQPPSTDSIVPVAQLWRQTSGVPGVGIGGSLDFLLSTISNPSQISTQITSEWTDATFASRTSKCKIVGLNSAVVTDIFSFEALACVSYSSVYGLVSTNSSLGILIQSSSNAANFQSPDATVSISQVDPNNGTVATAISIARSGSASVSTVPGLGASIDFNLSNTSTYFLAGQIISKVTDATPATESAEMDFNVMNSASLISALILKSTGVVNIPTSLGNFTNNAAAITGGLVAGDIYRNGDTLMIVH